MKNFNYTFFAEINYLIMLHPHLLKSIFQTRFTILKTFSEGVSLPAVTQIYKKFGVFFYYESEKKVL